MRVLRESAFKAVEHLDASDKRLLFESCLLGEMGDTLYFRDNAVTRELFLGEVESADNGSDDNSPE